MTSQQEQVRDLLSSIEEARSQTARSARNVQYLQSKCTSATPHYGHRSGGSGSDHAGLWDKLSEARVRLESDRQRLAELEQQISRKIDRLPKPRWRMVLRYRYLDGMTPAEIAIELSRATGREFSIHQIYRLHYQALSYAGQTWLPPS